MKQKKKKMSTLTRVLLCSWCVLGLVLTYFIIDWALDLSKPTGPAEPGNVDVFADITGDADPTQSVIPDATRPVDPTPTPVTVPQAEFVKEYTHLGETTERYGYLEEVSYGLRYPRCEESALEALVHETVNELLTASIDELSKEAGERCTLLIDYEDGETPGLYSVLFYIEKEVDGDVTTETALWVYNKKKGEPVAEPQQLFADRAYAYVAQQVNLLLTEEDTAKEPAEDSQASNADAEAVQLPEKPEGPFFGTREEFPEYVLTAEGAKFYYEIEGERQSIVIPYIALHTYMAVTENGTVVAEGIRDLDPEKPMIALTFDDGPHYNQTPRLLEILEKYNVKSTFFILGERTLWGPSNEKALTMVYEAGHEVASHTHTHKNLKQISVEDMKAEIVNARDAIYSVIGEYPTLVRPPYGAYNDAVKEFSYAPLIAWNLDSKDWDFRNAEKVIDHVLAEAGDGKIVLMHDIHWFTVDAVEVLIPELQSRGYQIVTVQELFHYKGVELENGKVYHSSYN